MANDVRQRAENAESVEQRVYFQMTEPPSPEGYGEPRDGRQKTDGRRQLGFIIYHLKTGKVRAE
jgi:hypothetical protein